MTPTYTNSLAAFAAVLIAFASIGTIVSVPPASAQTPAAAQFHAAPVIMTELA